MRYGIAWLLGSASLGAGSLVFDRSFVKREH
jgi:hypothetical protein